MSRLTIPLAALLLSLASTSALAGVVNATPDDYRAKLTALKPGDTLALAGGIYPLLPLNNLQGTGNAWITIQGPETGTPATIRVKPSNPGCCNLVQLENTAYLAIRNLRLDSQGYAHINGVNSRGTTHDILVADCTFVGQQNNQQNVAISTKGVAWNWTIRGNRILGAGTGIYLGSSSGRMPFINGVIENNLIADTVGYNMEIKWQLPYSLPPGLSEQPHRTIVRDNVFIKSKSQSYFPSGYGQGARPNVLVGGFPDSGPGSRDFYEIYGNLFFDNPDREALFQGSGRIVFHDNLLIGGTYRGATFQNHDRPIKVVHAFNNTVYGHTKGIVVQGTPQISRISGNLVIADGGVLGPGAAQNLTVPFASAANYVRRPSLTLGAMDWYPKANGLARATPIDLSAVNGHLGVLNDFNGNAKGDLSYRGAYAGEGVNPGWLPKRDIKN